MRSAHDKGGEMIVARLSVAALAFLAFAEPALACRGVFGHRYVFLEVPPKHLPKGAVLLTVSVPYDELDGGSALGDVPPPVQVRVIAASNKRLVGRKLTVRPNVFSSCGRWAESYKATHLVGFVERTARGFVLVPVVYRSKEYRTVGEENSVGIDRKHPGG
jgi:hypothetical protein